MVELANAGYPDQAIATRLGWSRATVRKWRRRGRGGGRAGLGTVLGRPPTGALASFPPLVRDTLAAWRAAHPGWRPATLQAELVRCPALAGQALPSRTSIARWLQVTGRTRRYERHQALPLPPAVPSQPHAVWELDARGAEAVPDVGVVALLNLTDRASKVKLLSYPCVLGRARAERHPTTEDYQLVVRQAFTEWGLPDALAVDRDSVFYDNSSPSPFPTRLHLWLLALEVALLIGPPHQPTVRGTIERGHQTWYQQVLRGQTFPTWEALHTALRQRREVLNQALPCASVGHQPPLVACPQARHARRSYRPDWEADLLDLSRVDRYLSQGRWFRRASNRGAVQLGQQRYVLGAEWAHREVEIHFDPRHRHLVCHSPDGRQMQRLPVQGLTATALMGEAGPLVHFDHLQLALPFGWSDWRVLRLSETFGGTT